MKESAEEVQNKSDFPLSGDASPKITALSMARARSRERLEFLKSAEAEEQLAQRIVQVAGNARQERSPFVVANALSGEFVETMGWEFAVKDSKFEGLIRGLVDRASVKAADTMGKKLAPANTAAISVQRPSSFSPESCVADLEDSEVRIVLEPWGGELGLRFLVGRPDCSIVARVELASSSLVKTAPMLKGSHQDSAVEMMNEDPIAVSIFDPINAAKSDR